MTLDGRRLLISAMCKNDKVVLNYRLEVDLLEDVRNFNLSQAEIDDHDKKVKAHKQKMAIYTKNLKQYEKQVEDGDIEDDDKSSKPDRPIPPRDLISSSFES